MKWLDRLLGRQESRASRPRDAAGKRARPTGAAVRPGAAPPAAKWQAVTIVPCLNACPAANMARRTRILASQAPRLPLPDCATPETCSCRFRKFDDRRAGERRLPYQNVGGLTYGGPERRRRSGPRRK
jgi:hypothetical protein